MPGCKGNQIGKSLLNGDRVLVLQDKKSENLLYKNVNILTAGLYTVKIRKFMFGIFCHYLKIFFEEIKNIQCHFFLHLITIVISLDIEF